MTVRTPHADDAQLQALLWADEESGEFRNASAHVANCESCRSRLEQLSGSQEIDEEVCNMLSSYPWDSASSPRDTVGADATASATESELDFLSPPSHPELLGRLGRYEIEREIGRGGMGIVLKANDTELNRPVAVKVLAKHLAHSGTARQRFSRESRAAAAVVHEHVVAIHNVEADGDVPFLVMQFVAGESLQARVDRDGPLSAKEILRIGIQAASGLAAAHEQGVIHRDIKPANMLLEHDVERVLLTDFGLARTVDDASLTQTGVIAGTPHYMSPEQAGGQPSDHRTDLFSLGSVLYFMAAGHPPFRAERAMGVLNRICHDRQTSLWKVNHGLPDELSVLVDRLLEKQPSKRVHSAEATREQLVKLLAQIQQPKPSVFRHLRRAAMRYPKRMLASVSLIAIVALTSLAVTVWPTAARDTTDNNGTVVQTERSASATSAGSALSGTADKSATSPNYGGQDTDDFDDTLNQLRNRLDALTEFGSFASTATNDDDHHSTLQSLHRRLKRLQGNEPTESQLNNPGDSQ